MFDSAVHSNSRLSATNKMNYLKAIKGLTSRSINYKTARELPEQRYGKRQLIVSPHLGDLLKLLDEYSMLSVVSKG